MKNSLRRNVGSRQGNLDFYTEEKMKRQRMIWISVSVVVLIIVGVLIKLFGDFLRNTEEKKRAEYEASEAYAGEQAVAEGERERAEYPLVAGLPVTNALFKIGYQFSRGGDELVIRVEATNTYMNQAVEKLKSIKTETKSLAEYDIEFSGFRDYLAEPAKSEKESPVEYLVEAYADVETECAIFDGKTEGDYYYTKITTGNASHYDLMTYRVVLIRDGETWKFASKPVPIVTIYNTPSVPEEILDRANSY